MRYDTSNTTAAACLCMQWCMPQQVHSNAAPGTIFVAAAHIACNAYNSVLRNCTSITLNFQCAPLSLLILNTLCGAVTSLSAEASGVETGKDSHGAGGMPMGGSPSAPHWHTSHSMAILACFCPRCLRKARNCTTHLSTLLPLTFCLMSL